MRVLLALFTTFGLLLPAWSQQADVTFEASSDAVEVTTKDLITVNFTLTNAKGSDFRPPSFDGFLVRSGPNRSVRSTFINGRQRMENTIYYTLIPKRTGTLVLGPARITVNGKVLRTAPLPIKVVAPGKSPASVTELLLKAVPSSRELWLGQQLVLDYKLFFRQNLENVRVISEPDYSGFFARELQRFRTAAMQEVENGKTYYTQVLRRMALYPQQSGRVRIAPLRLQVGILEGSSTGIQSLLRTGKWRNEVVASNALELDVNPLPTNAPASFTGAVGRYEVESRISREELSTRDALTITLSVTGTGDIKRVLPPKLEVPDGLEVYEPAVVREETFERRGRLLGTKVFEYQLLPRQAGTYTLRPAFSYFDPDSARYLTYAPEPYRIRVRPGGSRGAPPMVQADPEADLRPLKPMGRLRKPGGAFVGSPWFWGLSTLPWLLLGLAWGLARRQAHKRNEDPLQRRRRLAEKVIRERLRTARSWLEQGGDRPYYEALQQALLGYAADKLGLPAGATTPAEVTEALRRQGLDETALLSLRRILDRCQQAVYGGIMPDGQAEALYQQAVAWLEQQVID